MERPRRGYWQGPIGLGFEVHSQLVDVGREWLIRLGCSVVIAEPAGQSLYQIPDLLGFQDHGYSVQIEVKATASDYRRNTVKDRVATFPLGVRRYFLIPDTIARVVEQRADGWGFLVCETSTRRRRVLEAVPAAAKVGPTAPEYVAVDRCEETRTLVAAMRRAHRAGVLWVKPMGDALPFREDDHEHDHEH